MTTTTPDELMLEQEMEFNESEATKRFLTEMISAHGYSDPEVAVLREYVNNGRDAMIDVAPEDRRPVEVDLPCRANDWTLTITDHGCGLSLEETKRYHGGFFNTTKSGDARFAGNMGIGSKVGYSVADGFTVTTTKDGIRSIVFYQSKKDGRKTITPVFHGPVTREGEQGDVPDENDASNGTSIQIALGPLNHTQEQTWVEAARRIFAWCSEDDVVVRAGDDDVYVPREDISWLADGIGIRRGHTNQHVVLMGATPYPLPETELDDELKAMINHDGFSGVGRSISLVFEVPNKSMTAQISRESLTFNEASRAIIAEFSQRTIRLLHDHNQRVLDTLTPPVEHADWNRARRLLVGSVDLSKYVVRIEGQEVTPTHVPAPAYVTIAEGRGDNVVGSTMTKRSAIHDPTSESFDTRNTWIITDCADLKPETVRLAFSHHVKTDEEMLQTFKRRPWHDKTMHAVLRLDGPEGHERVFAHAGVLSGPDLVEARKTYLKERRAETNAAREKAKETIERQREEALARDEQVARELATTLLETRETINGEITYRSIEDIVALKSKKPLMYVTNTNYVTPYLMMFCGLNSRRLIIVSSETTRLIEALKSHKVNVVDLRKNIKDEIDDMLAREYKHAPKVFKEWINEDELTLDVVTHPLDAVHTLVQVSDVPLKPSAFKKFMDALDQTGLDVDVTGSNGHYHRSTLTRNGQQNRLRRFLAAHPLLRHINPDDTHRQSFADDFVDYINRKKVVI